MRPIGILWIVPLTLTACQARQSAPAETAAEPPPKEIASAASSPAEAALGALETAQAALVAWRGEVEAGARLDDGALLSLRAASQAVGREIQALLSEVELRDAEVRPDPQQSQQGLSMLARGVAQPWIDGVRALGEGAAERRAEALDAVRQALSSEDRVQQLAALTTLQHVGDVQFDKAPFRPLVAPYVREGTGPMLVAALYALYNTDRKPEDLQLVYAAWERDRGGLEYRTLHMLALFGEGRLEGRSEEIALECLADVDGRRVNQQLNGLWGAKVGPRLEARVLELSRSSDWEIRHGAIYFGLSTFADKSEVVVDELIATLSDPDANNWDRALWGLGHGVPQALQPKVAAALVDLHNSRSDPQVRETCVGLVERYGGAAALDRLQR